MRQTTATKNEKRIRTVALLFRQQDCVFHSRQSNLKGVENAIELLEKIVIGGKETVTGKPQEVHIYYKIDIGSIL